MTTKTECENGWIQTHSGGRFYPFAPRMEDLRLGDICHALANLCRFTGHCRMFYSVGQHSLAVAALVSPEARLAALLHDASEAYLGDVPRPLKRMPEFALYREAEQRVQAMIYECFGVRLTPDIEGQVERADKLALAMEAEELMPQREKPEWAWLPVTDKLGLRKTLSHWLYATPDIISGLLAEQIATAMGAAPSPLELRHAPGPATTVPTPA